MLLSIILIALLHVLTLSVKCLVLQASSRYYRVQEGRLPRAGVADDEAVEGKAAVLVALSNDVSCPYLYWTDHVFHLASHIASIHKELERPPRVLAEGLLPETDPKLVRYASVVPCFSASLERHAITRTAGGEDFLDRLGVQYRYLGLWTLYFVDIEEFAQIQHAFWLKLETSSCLHDLFTD